MSTPGRPQSREKQITRALRWTWRGPDRPRSKFAVQITKWVVTAEWTLEWAVYWLRRMAFLELVGLLAGFSIVWAALQAVSSIEEQALDTRRQRQFQAWQVINSAAGTKADGGRSLALQDLVRDSVPLTGIQLDSAVLHGLVLWSADLGIGALLASSSFRGAHLHDAVLREANLFRANLSGATLYQANLSGADLSGANLSGAGLFYADFSGAHLSYANLSGADLTGANFSGAGLTGADLSEADLTDADLSGADLSGAVLVGTNLREAREIDRATLAKSCADESTTWPIDFDWGAAGVVTQGEACDR